MRRKNMRDLTNHPRGAFIKCPIIHKWGLWLNSLNHGYIGPHLNLTCAIMIALCYFRREDENAGTTKKNQPAPALRNWMTWKAAPEYTKSTTMISDSAFISIISWDPIRFLKIVGLVYESQMVSEHRELFSPSTQPMTGIPHTRIWTLKGPSKVSSKKHYNLSISYRKKI